MHFKVLRSRDINFNYQLVLSQLLIRFYINIMAKTIAEITQDFE